MKRSCNLLIVIFILFLVVVIFFGELPIGEDIPSNIGIGLAIVGSPQVLYNYVICAVIYVLILSAVNAGFFLLSVVAKEWDGSSKISS